MKYAFTSKEDLFLILDLMRGGESLGGDNERVAKSWSIFVTLRAVSCFGRGFGFPSGQARPIHNGGG